MKSSFSRSVLFSLAATAAVAFSPCAFAQGDAPSASETARRQMALRDAMQQVQEARHAYTDKKYSTAVEHYRNALAVIPKAPATEKQQAFIKDSLSDALIATAMDYRSVGRTDEALAFLKEAIELSPSNDRARKELLRTEDPVRTNPALTPQHVGNVEEVTRLLELGHGYLALGVYDKAISSFESVLRIDRYNTAAQRGIESARKRQQQYYAAARDSYRAHVLTDADCLWDEEAPQDVALNMPAEEQGGVTESGETEARIGAAIGEMVMPQVVFDDAPVTDVVEALQAQIRRFETSGASTAGRPVNLIANFGTPDSQGYKDIMSRRVNLNLSDVSLRQVLDALARQLGITYYVTPLGVELSYSGRDFGPMVERIYTVSPHFFDAETGGDDEDDDDDFSSSSSHIVVKRVNPVQALKGMGISFPEGSNARYDASSRQLTVRNTPFNQEEIAGLLSVPIDAPNRSVVLNIMAVEVNENDLKELGFEWMVNMNLGSDFLYAAGGPFTTAALAGWPLGGNPLAQQGADRPLGSMTEGLRSGGQAVSADNIERLIATGGVNAFNASNSAAAKAPGILSLRGIWKEGDVAMIMRGLEQKKGADILYNPRLVLTPGAEQQCTFTNVREMFYPETYSEPQIATMNINLGNRNNGNNNNNRNRNGRSTVATAAHPEEFTRFGMSEDSVGGIGAVVQVHDAQVAQDGQVVTLALTVTLNDFEGFINWGSPIKSVMMTDGDNPEMAYVTLTENHILKPVFKRHMENTKISVAPGSVIVMGGLQEARSVKFEDKLPVLGDLPLVGRLFRSEGSEKVRKAFLFFVKVDLVDPTGRDVLSGDRSAETALTD